MFQIRPIHPEEYEVLNDFLYEAIFVPKGETPPPRSIIQEPALQVYVENFGKKKDDIAFVVEVEGHIIGTVWVRDMQDYGHVEDGVPSFAISLYPEYRGCGIGTALMKKMLQELTERGYDRASLSVQKQNAAARLYQRLGFEIIDENEEEYIMIWRNKSDSITV